LKPRRLVYYGIERWEPLRIGLVIAYSLLLSNSVRKDTRVIVDTIYRGYETRLVVDRSVRHLRLDEDSLRGFVISAVKGRLRGVKVTKPAPMGGVYCITCNNDGLDARLPLPSMRTGAEVAVILGNSRYFRCWHVVEVEACRGLPEWLAVGVLQVLLDRVLGYGAGGARG